MYAWTLTLTWTQITDHGFVDGKLYSNYRNWFMWCQFLSSSLCSGHVIIAISPIYVPTN